MSPGCPLDSLRASSWPSLAQRLRLPARAPSRTVAQPARRPKASPREVKIAIAMPVRHKRRRRAQWTGRPVGRGGKISFFEIAPEKISGPAANRGGAGGWGGGSLPAGPIFQLACSAAKRKDLD